VFLVRSPIHVFHSVYCLERVYGIAYRKILAAPKAATTGLVAVLFQDTVYERSSRWCRMRVKCNIDN
jgi:hypothetical protein